MGQYDNPICHTGPLGYICWWNQFLGSLKVVGNEKEGGVKTVANDRNWPQTTAIEVCLRYNFAVVFDFIYFCFRPSKAK
jgi:hypothetical protein